MQSDVNSGIGHLITALEELKNCKNYISFSSAYIIQLNFAVICAAMLWTHHGYPIFALNTQ